MPSQRVQTCELLATSLALERTQTLVQQHVPLAVVLSRKTDDG